MPTRSSTSSSASISRCARSSRRTIIRTTSAASPRCSRERPVPVYGPARETIPGRTQALARTTRSSCPESAARCACSMCRATPPATSRTYATGTTGSRSSATRCSPAAAVACSRARRRRWRRRSPSSPRCRRDGGLLRARVHARESALRRGGRARQRRVAARVAREAGEARARRADGAVDDRRRARYQSVPSLHRARRRRRRAGARGTRARRRRSRRSPCCARGRTNFARTTGAVRRLTLPVPAPTIAGQFLPPDDRSNCSFPESPASRSRCSSPRARRRRRNRLPHHLRPSPQSQHPRLRLRSPHRLTPRPRAASTDPLPAGRERRARSRCRRPPTICGCASARASTFPPSKARKSRSGRSGTRLGPTTSRA